MNITVKNSNLWLKVEPDCIIEKTVSPLKKYNRTKTGAKKERLSGRVLVPKDHIGKTAIYILTEPPEETRNKVVATEESQFGDKPRGVDEKKPKPLKPLPGELVVNGVKIQNYGYTFQYISHQRNNKGYYIGYSYMPEEWVNKKVIGFILKQ